MQRVAKRLWAATTDERWAALSKIQAMAGFAEFHVRIAQLVWTRAHDICSAQTSWQGHWVMR